MCAPTLTCLCAHRPRDHADRSIQPLHKQQLCGSSHPGPFLCSHPVRICLLPLQAQVSSRIDPSWRRACRQHCGNTNTGLCHPSEAQWGCRETLGWGHVTCEPLQFGKVKFEKLQASLKPLCDRLLEHRIISNSLLSDVKTFLESLTFESSQ